MRAQANLILNDLFFGILILGITIAGVSAFQYVNSFEEQSEKHRSNIETSYDTRLLLNTKVQGIKLYDRIRLGEPENKTVQRIANKVRRTLETNEAWLVWIDKVYLITPNEILNKDNEELLEEGETYSQSRSESGYSAGRTLLDEIAVRHKQAPKMVVPTQESHKNVLFQFISEDEFIDTRNELIERTPRGTPT